MRLKVEKLGEGLHPSEMFISIQTRAGAEELVVDARAVRDSQLEVGWPVGTDGDFLLIELPRQTARGAWRVWVRQEHLTSDEKIRATA